LSGLFFGRSGRHATTPTRVQSSAGAGFVFLQRKFMTNQTLLRFPAVKVETGFSRSTVHRRIREGLFPSPVNLGIRAVGWPAAEVEAINRARIAGKSNDEVRALVQKLHAARKA
jgi:prophage regulatory protein